MYVSYKDSAVRMTGRWDTSLDDRATATATGSYIEFAFEGTWATAHFDIESNGCPYAHLWVQLDGGVMTECPVDMYLKIRATSDGEHICRIIYKGGAEAFRRWKAPLRGKITFCGFTAEKPIPIAPDNRPTIEFVGDSITEGVLTDADCIVSGEKWELDQLNRGYMDDVCETYAWKVAERLGLRPFFMGYGAVGVSKSGQGGVPAAATAYPYNFENSPITRPTPDYIMINHGANDRRVTPEVYVEKYGELIDLIRKMNPTSEIISLSAFCGAFHEELGRFIAEYNEKNGTRVAFIDSNGWVPLEPLHPLGPGHTVIADNLAPILADVISDFAKNK